MPRIVIQFFVCIVQRFTVHHRDLGILHAVQLVAIGQECMMGCRVVQAFIVSSTSRQVMFGSGGEMVCCHAMALANGLDVVVLRRIGCVRVGGVLGCVVSAHRWLL